MPRRHARVADLKSLKADLESCLARAREFAYLAFVEGGLEEALEDLESEIEDHEIDEGQVEDGKAVAR